MAGGVIVDDFDNDGLFDVVTSSFDTCGPMHFFTITATERLLTVLRKLDSPASWVG